MDEYKKLLIWTSSMSAVVAISLNIFYSNIQVECLVFKIALILVFDFITYGAVFAAIWNIYKRLIWKKTHKHLNVNGHWYHVHIMDKQDDYLRIGEVDITQDFYELQLSAHNYNVRYDYSCDNLSIIETQCTIWSEKAHLDKSGSIWGMYTAKRTFGNFTQRQGAHSFDISTVKDKKSDASEIFGYFQDMSPYNRVGVIKMFKDQQKRDEYVKELCKERKSKTNKKEYVSVVTTDVQTITQ